MKYSARRPRTQSKAFDSLAHTRGHSNGVIVALASRLPISDSIVGVSEREDTCSVVDVQDSQELVSDLNSPDCDQTVRRSRHGGY